MLGDKYYKEQKHTAFQLRNIISTLQIKYGKNIADRFNAGNH